MPWSAGQRILPALGFHFLTRWYDPVVARTTREGTVKSRLLDCADLGPGDRVLDLGCGTGTLAIMAKSRVSSAKVTGIDGDPAVLARARAKSEARHMSIEFVQAWATDLPLESSSVDCVLTSLFLHHLWPHERLAALGEVQRVLRAGGRFLVADWGAPKSVVQKAGFTLVRLLDGVARTREHAADRLPELFAAAAFEDVTLCDDVQTPLGRIVLFAMRRSTAPPQLAQGAPRV